MDNARLVSRGSQGIDMSKRLQVQDEGTGQSIIPVRRVRARYICPEFAFNFGVGMGGQRKTGGIAPDMLNPISWRRVLESPEKHRVVPHDLPWDDNVAFLLKSECRAFSPAAPKGA